MRKEHVAVRQVRVGVEGDRRHGKLPLERPPVQALDVGELVREREALGCNAPLRERVEHEGVVRVRAVRDRDRIHMRIILPGALDIRRW